MTSGIGTPSENGTDSIQKIVQREYGTIEITMASGIVVRYKLQEETYNLVQGLLVKYPNLVPEGTVVMFAPSAPFSVPWFVAFEKEA